MTTYYDYYLPLTMTTCLRHDADRRTSLGTRPLDQPRHLARVRVRVGVRVGVGLGVGVGVGVGLRVRVRVSGHLVELDRAARDDVAALALAPPRLGRVGR